MAEIGIYKNSLSPRSNVANKVRNTSLPRTKPLMPLFEVISNSIHAISEAKKANLLNGEGKIRIKLIRNGHEDILKETSDIDKYPINSFAVTDNGIGLNDENLSHFSEADTDHKIEIGGKGVGRFVCLKAFKSMLMTSYYNSNGTTIERKFEFKPTKEAFHNYTQIEASNQNIGTKVVLSEIKDEYKRNLPLSLFEIARAVTVHFQLYFIQNTAPEIVIENQNSEEVNLKNLFSTEFRADIKEKTFSVGEFFFNLYLAKSATAQSHKLHFCAHHRSVKDEGLSNRIVDLGKYSVKTEDGNYYYQAFVTGEALDNNVDLERVGFNFPNDTEDDEEEDPEQLTLAKIRNGAIVSIEELLSSYLDKVRLEKMQKYTPIIDEELIQYKSTLHYKIDAVKRLPPNLSKHKLDVELYKIESDWRLEVKEKGNEILEEKKDVTNLDAYKQKYEEFLNEFNEIGKADLARYIVHRKAVIELLEKLIGTESPDDSFTNEDIIHSIFFPIRSSSDEVPHSKQNLWLLDERLTFHSFLSSDRTFEKMPQISVSNGHRPDLMIFQDAIAFTEDKTAPHNSFTIVEFKKPQRDNYKDNDAQKNPLDQVEMYIDDLLEGRVTNRQNRQIQIDRNTPFYVYIVCDITDSFKKILEKREFSKTPDGMGYFTFKNKYYSAYIEVLPFEKVLRDAKKRNKILFEKLGINSTF